MQRLRSLRHRLPVLGGALALLVFACAMVPTMGTGFIPSMNSPQMSATLTMPKEANTAETYAMADDVMEALCAIDGVEMSPLTLVEKLNELGGKNGIGLLDIVENRLVGMKSRGVYETPGGTILYKAHQMLEMITLDRDTAHYKKLVAEKYGELVYNGLWFSPLREALDAFVNKTQETVTGDVKLKLYKGNVMNAGITSPYTLYDETVASFGDDGGAYNQKDAAGFINLFGLPLKVKALLDQKREANED